MVLDLSFLCQQEPIKPLEKRALNFLVNEFLLKNNYKLTSITFSDESDDQVLLLLYNYMYSFYVFATYLLFYLIALIFSKSDGCLEARVI